MIGRVSNFSGPLSLNFSTFIGTSATSSPPISATGSFNLLILGDLSVSSVETNLRNYFNTTSYTFSISTRQMSTTYTASDVNNASYSVILLYTNGAQYGAASIGANLSKFCANGGGLVTAVFYWNIHPYFTDTTISPWSWIGIGQSSAVLNLTFSPGVHPIVNGLTALTLSGGTSYFINMVNTLIPGAQNIATWSGSSYPAIAVGTTGSARIVGLNYFPPGISSYPNARPMFANAILWASKVI